MKVLTATLGLAVVAALGYGWLKEHDRRLVAQRDARRSADSLAAAVARTTREAREAHTADSLAYAIRIRKQDAALIRVRAESDNNAIAAQRLADSLQAMVGDDTALAGVVERTVAAFAAERAARLAERAAADSALTVARARITTLEATYATDLGAVRTQLAAALTQLDAANRRASPGLVSRAVAMLPWVAGAYVAGRVVR